MKTIKQLTAECEARRPYWIDTNVFCSEKLARKNGFPRWAVSVDALPELDGMKCLITVKGSFRYVLEGDTPEQSPDAFKAPLLAELATYGIPIREAKPKSTPSKPTQAREAKPKSTPSKPTQAREAKPKSTPRVITYTKPQQLAFSF